MKYSLNLSFNIYSYSLHLKNNEIIFQDNLNQGAPQKEPPTVAKNRISVMNAFQIVVNLRYAPLFSPSEQDQVEARL